MRNSWLEISLSRLHENVLSIQKGLNPSTHIIAVVKANAYGHGLEVISKSLFDCGISSFAVATLDEAINLRQSIPKCKILVLQGCLRGDEKVFRKYQLTAALHDLQHIPENIKIEIKINTGMNRLGIPWKEARKEIKKIDNEVTGLYSHFASSDDDPDFTRLQLERFENATAGLPYTRHISNSAGLQFPEANLDAVRLGLLLYGIPPSPLLEFVNPILSWKTRILTLQNVSKGQSIGYGRTFVAPRKSLIGVLPVGYADGYKQLFSRGGQVRVQNHLAPVVGLVSMDLISIDLTNIPNVSVGQEVILLENTHDSPLSVSTYAKTLGITPYEILTAIGDRIKRVYVAAGPHTITT